MSELRGLVQITSLPGKILISVCMTNILACFHFTHDAAYLPLGNDRKVDILCLL